VKDKKTQPQEDTSEKPVLKSKRTRATALSDQMPASKPKTTKEANNGKSSAVPKTTSQPNPKQPKNSKPAPSKDVEPTQPGKKPNFGIKSLDDLLKERELAAANPSSEKTTPTEKIHSNGVQPTNETKNQSPNIQELRKKNAAKFKKSPAAPRKATIASPETPKRQAQIQATESSQSKRLKLNSETPTKQVAATTPPTTNPTPSNPSLVIKGSELDDYDDFDDFGDLGGDSFVDVDGDELDKDLDELETLMKE